MKQLRYIAILTLVLSFTGILYAQGPTNENPLHPSHVRGRQTLILTSGNFSLVIYGLPGSRAGPDSEIWSSTLMQVSLMKTLISTSD